MKFNNEILGAMCLIAAGFFLSFGGLFIRLIEDASTMQITSYRAVTFSLVALIYIIFKYDRGYSHFLLDFTLFNTQKIYLAVTKNFLK